MIATSATLAKRKAFWTPQPGPQAHALVCPVDFIFFGGSRGGGKSDTMMGRQLAKAEQYGQHFNGLIIRRKYKEFSELRRRFDELIREGLPAERIGGDNQENVIRFKGPYKGARITLTAMSSVAMADDHQGLQYQEIGIDEAPKLPFIDGLIEKMKGCLRSPHGVPCNMCLTGNPGGPGHMAVKTMFIDPAPRGGRIITDKAGDTRVFIPSSLADNRILVEADPRYVARLRSIKNPALRRAWLNGDWSVFLDQAFHFDPLYHVLPGCPPIPADAPIYMTFDWGYGAPFSIGWWWVDNDGRLYRFSEWYGWTGVPGEGLRLPDSAIAEGILERENEMGIHGRRIIRLAGPDCFQGRPAYERGGQSPSTAQTLGRFGIFLQSGDASRKMKIRQFRERMRLTIDDFGKVREMPMLVVYPTCTEFIRTVPALALDELDPEDVDTDQEDHVYDEACHIVMDRPMTAADLLHQPASTAHALAKAAAAEPAG